VSKKYLEVQDADLQQLVILAKIIGEGKFEIKGDAILTVASSLRYLGQLTERVKNAGPAPAPAQPEFIPTEAPKLEVDLSSVKGRKRAK
jgi:hypothetical protein